MARAAFTSPPKFRQGYDRDQRTATMSSSPVAEKRSSDNGDAEATKSEVALAHSPSPDDFGFTEEEQKAIIRRIDLRLVTVVGLMYCVSLMDRTNLGAANIAGMEAELKLKGNQYVSWSARAKEKETRMTLSNCVDRTSFRSSFSSHISSSRSRRRSL